MPPAAYQTFLAGIQSRVAAAESGDESARTRTNEIDFFRRDGTTVTTEIVTRLICDDSGRVRHVLAICRDISEQKRADELIRLRNQTIDEAKRHYRRMFNSISDAVFVHKLEEDGFPGQFLEVNDSACSCLGYTREELLGMRLIDIDAPEERSHAPGHLLRLLAEGQLIWQGTQVARNARRIPVEFSATRFELDGSAMFITSVRDIT